MTGDEDPPIGEDRTVFMPSGAATPPPSPTPPNPPTQPPPPREPATSFGGGAVVIPGAGEGRVAIGDVLNNIYEVKRLIGRGGMGEVFEGVNVNDDHDRVAIKVMLPALAADPNVQAMFRKEARTLTRLSHPAVVQYRVLAQEPRLGVFYIVTEFIQGEPLSDVMGRNKPSAAELRGLIRRLAEGLRAAHTLGAVHRDMSPDNVLLQDGELARAKIIDFGIAKDLDPSNATIVGDGFAGKLGFVAPEQFGDFDRQIGPWTDVYSLGLVILSLAAGKNIDMGATLVEAVDRRRAGPDLSVMPPELQPLLARMTAANPANRLRSMDEVLAMLDGSPLADPAPAPAPQTNRAKPEKAVKPKPAPAVGLARPDARKRPMWPILAGVGALVVVAIGAAVVMAPHRPGATATTAAASTSGAPSATSAETARRAIEAALPGVACSWLDLVSATPAAGGVAVKLTGVAGSTQAANAAVLSAAKGAGVTVPDVDLADVLPVDSSVCQSLDAFRPFRADTSATGRRLSTSQAKYTLEKQPNGSLAQKAIITMAIGDPSLDFAIYGIEPTGAIDSLEPSPGIASDRKWFEAGIKNPQQQNVSMLGNDIYRLSVNVSPPVGLQGLLLLTGKGPFDIGLIAAPRSSRGADWPAKVAQAAKAGGWKAEMVWFQTVEPAK